MNDEQFAIRTEGLTRTFGVQVAVDDLTFAIPRGTLFGLVGRNGAGKSTTVNLLTGFLRPTRGHASVLGAGVLQQPIEVKRLVGVVPETLSLFDKLDVYEHLQFVGRIHGIPTADLEGRSKQLLQFFNLDGYANRYAEVLSHGMRKALALACALLPDPQLLFLDEPFEGMDPVNANRLEDVLRQYTSRGGTVFLTSHVLDLVERLCTRVGIIDRGRLLSELTADDLRAARTGNRSHIQQLLLELAGPEAAKEIPWLGQRRVR